MTEKGSALTFDIELQPHFCGIQDLQIWILVMVFESVLLGLECLIDFFSLENFSALLRPWQIASAWTTADSGRPWSKLIWSGCRNIAGDWEPETCIPSLLACLPPGPGNQSTEASTSCRFQLKRYIFCSNLSSGLTVMIYKYCMNTLKVKLKGCLCWKEDYDSCTTFVI